MFTKEWLHLKSNKLVERAGLVRKFFGEETQIELGLLETASNILKAKEPIELLPLSSTQVILDNELIDVDLLFLWLETEKPSIHNHTPYLFCNWLRGWILPSNPNEMRKTIGTARYYVSILKKYGFRF